MGALGVDVSEAFLLFIVGVRPLFDWVGVFGVGCTAVVVQVKFTNIAFVAGPTYPVGEMLLSL